MKIKLRSFSDWIITIVVVVVVITLVIIILLFTNPNNSYIVLLPSEIYNIHNPINTDFTFAIQAILFLFSIQKKM